MRREINTRLNRSITISKMDRTTAFLTLVASDTGKSLGAHLERDEAIAIRDALLDIYPLGLLPAPTPKAKAEPKTLTPQAQKILGYLRTHGNISASEAATVFKVRALPRRIADIKATGVNVTSEFKKDSTGQRYVRYHLAAA